MNEDLAENNLFSCAVAGVSNHGHCDIFLIIIYA